MTDYAHFDRQIESALSAIEGASSLVQAQKIAAVQIQRSKSKKFLNHYARLYSLGEDLERIQRELHQIKIDGIRALPDEADDTYT
jgi:hypothetical protein